MLFAQCIFVDVVATVYLSLLNVLFARRNCSRVAGLPGVRYSFAYDSTADAGSGRFDVALLADVLLLSTSRLNFLCFILPTPGRALPCYFIVLM